MYRGILAYSLIFRYTKNEHSICKIKNRQGGKMKVEDVGLETVRSTFYADRFATENGLVIDAVGEHYAKCSFAVENRHKNALGAVMGGASFTLADFAFAVASNWQTPGTVSLSSNITYVGTARGERLIAEAHCVKDGRTTCCYHIDVRDDLDNLVAVVTTTGYHK